MNTLSYAIVPPGEYGFTTFQLLVDGTPMQEFAGYVECVLPYWEIKGDFSVAEPDPTSEDDCLRIVGTCDCGESGCGATHARVTKDATTVRIADFSGWRRPGASQEVVVGRENYDRVMRELTGFAEQERQIDEARVKAAEALRRQGSQPNVP